MTLESSRETVAIAIDLGGTRSRVAAVAADGTILARTECATDADAGPDAVIEDLLNGVGQIRHAVADRNPIGLGVAAPGPVDHVAGVVIQAPNLGWRNVPLAERLQAATQLRTMLANDANLAALGEARFGAGRGARNLVYLTVSTGVGSGFVVDGSLVVGEYGAAAEAGHMTIWWNGRQCSCGNRGCLEAYASGTALVERAQDAIHGGRASALASYSAPLEATDVAQAAAEGDSLAQELIREAGIALGFGVRNLLHLLDPEVVIIGGGVSRIGAQLWDPMLEVVHDDRLGAYAQRARVVPAGLADDPGLIGAASMVYDALNPPAAGLP